MGPARLSLLPRLRWMRVSVSDPVGDHSTGIDPDEPDLIARIHSALDRPAGRPWFWTLLTNEGRSLGSGFEATEEAAFEKVERLHAERTGRHSRSGTPNRQPMFYGDVRDATRARIVAIGDSWIGIMCGTPRCAPGFRQRGRPCRERPHDARLGQMRHIGVSLLRLRRPHVARDRSAVGDDLDRNRRCVD